MQAQQEGPMKPIVSLIGNPDVQQELDLAEPQLKGIRDALEKLKGEFLPKVEEMQKLSAEEKATARPALMRDLINGAENALSEVMRPDQFQRFQQLRLQGEGIAAFQRDTVREKLEFTEEQAGAIRDVVQNTRQRLEDLQSGDAGGPEQVAQAQEDALQAITKLFSEEQANAWQEMLGDKM